MNKFILINLNQTISRAELSAIKEERLRWIMFGIICSFIIALSKSEKLKQLISLNLSKNNITDDGAKALARSISLGKLKKLDLNFNRIGDEGAFAIAESKSLSNLESLKLGQNKIGTEGTTALNKSKTFSEKLGIK